MNGGIMLRKCDGQFDLTPFYVCQNYANRVTTWANDGYVFLRRAKCHIALEKW